MNWGVFALFASLAIFFIIRMPISFSMLASCIVYFLIARPASMGMVYSVITGDMITGFTMLAAPLFVFMANVLNDSGMSGSAIADASGIGLMEIEQMKKEGYDAEFSCAITAASATVGPIFPPSIPMVIYAMLSGASVGKLFAGGMVPGVLLALMLMVYCFYISYKRNYPAGVKMTLKQFGRATLVAFPALFTVILLLGGIYSGVCTPTEAGAVASAYALLISAVVYRTLGWKRLATILKKTAANTATLAALCGTAYLFSKIIALEKVPNAVSSFVTGITTNKNLFLLVVNIVFLLLGCVLDVSTIQLVFVPMVLPIVKAFGIDLVHFGVVICLNMMIGLSTPPFGMLLFIVSGLGKTKIGGVIKEIIPMVLIMILLLFMCTYIPDIIMFIPNHMAG